jgi:hypothetical protein
MYFYKSPALSLQATFSQRERELIDSFLQTQAPFIVWAILFYVSQSIDERYFGLML